MSTVGVRVRHVLLHRQNGSVPNLRPLALQLARIVDDLSQGVHVKGVQLRCVHIRVTLESKSEIIKPKRESVCYITESLLCGSKEKLRLAN